MQLNKFEPPASTPNNVLLTGLMLHIVMARLSMVSSYMVT